MHKYQCHEKIFVDKFCFLFNKKPWGKLMVINVNLIVDQNRNFFVQKSLSSSIVCIHGGGPFGICMEVSFRWVSGHAISRCTPVPQVVSSGFYYSKLQFLSWITWGLVKVDDMEFDGSHALSGHRFGRCNALRIIVQVA